MKIKYLKTAVKDVKKIKTKTLQHKIKDIFSLIEKSNSLNDIPNVKKLSGHPSAYRLRIGDYRMGFYYENETIVIARIVKRNDIYKLFP